MKDTITQSIHNHLTVFVRPQCTVGTHLIGNYTLAEERKKYKWANKFWSRKNSIVFSVLYNQLHPLRRKHLSRSNFDLCKWLGPLNFPIRRVFLRLKMIIDQVLFENNFLTPAQMYILLKGCSRLYKTDCIW